MRSLLRLLIVLTLIAGIVIFWLNLGKLGIHANAKFYLLGGGGSVFAIGLMLKLLGRWDLIPDWLPLIGKMDDYLAWVLMSIGVAMGIVGWFAF
jgi:hypothetical protein